MQGILLKEIPRKMDDLRKSSNNFGTDLSSICYEQIVDNYYYGIYGDFKLIIDKTTGYFNATKFCADGGRQFRKWKRNKNSKALIDYYSKQSVKKIYVITGGQNLIIRGTYVFNELILSIAVWISSDKADRIFYYENKFEKCQRDNQLDDRLQEMEIEMKKIEILNKGQQKYENIKADVSPKLNNPKKLHMFTIIKKNGKRGCEYPYYV